MAEKIDIHRYEQRYRAALKRFRRCRNVIPQNRDLIVRFLDDCELGKTIKNAQKKRIGAARRLKYLNTLKRLSAWLNKPFERVAQQDMEKLIRRLDRNEYKGRAGKVFSEETKADYKKAVKKFYKWLQGDNEKYPELVNWIETFVKVKEIPALSRDQVEKMMERCSKPRDKALIAVLFDSGARAQEFLNIRLLHLTKKDDYYVVRIEHSKTKPRTISLPLCTKELEA